MRESLQMRVLHQADLKDEFGNVGRKAQVATAD